MKKGIFGLLNYLLPHEHNTLPMHCSANIGTHGDAAVFFGLSGFRARAKLRSRLTPTATWSATTNTAGYWGKAVFSTLRAAATVCLPLHPTRYAEMLGQKMEEHDMHIWLVNTGWTGGG